VPNYVSFAGFKVHGAGHAVVPPPLPERKIEFLGDSITAGFCNECSYTPPASVANDHGESFAASWDLRMGAILGAQVHTVAWSGLGMVRNCCGGNTTMPAIFDRTLATVNTANIVGARAAATTNKWDFSSWKADALVVNLGTNDNSAAIDPSYNYTDTYEQLVLRAAASYGPALHVFLACGPMSELYCDPVQEVLRRVTAKGVQAHFLDQRGFLNGSFGPACCGHPSSQVDAAMATHGAAAIKAALGW